MDMTATQSSPPVTTPIDGRPPLQQAPDPSALEITYSTISPKLEQTPQPNFPMHIKLSLIDQSPRASNLPGYAFFFSFVCVDELVY